MNKKSNHKVASAKESLRKRDPELFEPGADKAGIASDYISDIRSLKRRSPKRGQRVVIYCRVSGRDQERSQNLCDQDENLERELEKLGFNVIESLGEVGAGWKGDRDGLLRAVEIAHENDAVVVAESVTRFIRSRDYNSVTNWNAKPTVADYNRLQLETDGVELATLINPDATPEEIRSYETKRGKKSKGNPGGRPKKCSPGYKKRERQMYLPKVLELYKQNKNIAAIARSVNLKYDTVYSWVVKFS